MKFPIVVGWMMQGAAVGVIGVAMLIGRYAPPASAADSSGDLASDIHAVLRDKYFAKASVGVTVVRLGSSASDSTPIFRSDADKPLMPASNLKLLTTSAALSSFGSDFQFTTKLLRHGDDLYLIGDGDPTFGDAELLKKSGWGVRTVFQSWAGELKKRGITTIGNVCVDDSVFDEVFIHPDWSPRYASASDSAQVAGVNLNANCVDFYLTVGSRGQTVSYRTDPPTHYINVKNTCISGGRDAVALGRVNGTNDFVLSGEDNVDSVNPISVTVNDPALYAATVLSETLADEGITVTGTVQRDRTAHEKAEQSPSDWTAVAILKTPISTVLKRANTDSMNLYAECLCKRLGHATTNQPGSWANGTAAVASFLQKIGIASDQFHLDDGCGLSRDDNVSPDAIAHLLVYDYFSKNKPTFLHSLAIAGVDGTLEHRFEGPLRQRVFAKSGYISGVSSLSGYLKTQDNRWFVFSILMNDLPAGTNNTAKDMQERIVRAIDRDAK
jgi:D-alanyl-D-alanine carboxypeptidase/D-alanyl-D-alanine-endopeptidase (penicillin-binding protein 4)